MLFLAGGDRSLEFLVRLCNRVVRNVDDFRTIFDYYCPQNNTLELLG